MINKCSDEGRSFTEGRLMKSKSEREMMEGGCNNRRDRMPEHNENTERSKKCSTTEKENFGTQR